MALTGLAHVSGQQAIEINGVLRNTYIMLGLSIGFAALLSYIGLLLQIGFMNPLLYIAGIFGFSYAVQKTADSVWGLVWSFAFAGFIGIFIAPILNVYIAINPWLVAQAFALTSAALFALSAYTIVRREDFSWLGSFITVACFVLLGIFVLSFFVNMTPFAMLISAFVVVVACALILYQTSAIVLGGERNYIIASNQLFVGFYLMFLSILQLLGIFGGDD